MKASSAIQTDAVSETRVRDDSAFDLIPSSARTLFENGQTTERVVRTIAHLAGVLGSKASIIPDWGKLTVIVETALGPREQVLPITPTKIDIRKVGETMRVINQLLASEIDVTAARQSIERISHEGPVSLIRFALLSAAGAAGLGVIFGSTDPVSLTLIGFSAGAGACVRRWLGGWHANYFFHPMAAALLASIVAAIAYRLQPNLPFRLIAGVPCLMLIPGAHILNGALDLVRARMTLGIARLTFAMMNILAICFGLSLGVVLFGLTIPPAAPAQPVPFLYDVIAAGVAAAAFATAFAMPWRMIPITMIIGMIAHAVRWLAMANGLDPAAAALIASFVAGVMITPIVDWLQMPFAGVGFASVVALIPGSIIIRVAGGMLLLVKLGAQAPPDLPSRVLADVVTAFLIIAGIMLGLILPTLMIGRFTESWIYRHRTAQ
jgi:uncharacterized membrane protein YjjP (DUF1212 family)